MEELNQMIEKYHIQLNTVKEVIKKSDNNEDILTAQAVERFLKVFLKDLHSLNKQQCAIHDVIASASFKNDLEKAIEFGETVEFNEDGGYDYFSKSYAFEAVIKVLKKHLLTADG